MRVLIFHGYLLRGTGSNVYNAELAEALVRLGHEVHLLCQERAPERARLRRLGGRVGGRQARGARTCGGPPHAGRCTVYRPDIGGLLPVYVYDDYEGFEVRTFDHLTDEELERYLERERRARCATWRQAADIEAGLREPPPDGPGDPRARRSATCRTR